MDSRDDTSRGFRSDDREKREGVAALRSILIGLGAASVFWTAAVVSLIVLL